MFLSVDAFKSLCGLVNDTKISTDKLIRTEINREMHDFGWLDDMNYDMDSANALIRTLIPPHHC